MSDAFEWTEGVCGDGSVILRDGIPVTISDILTILNKPDGACRKLLSEGLDLCVRARKMDAADRREATLSIARDPDSWVSSGEFDRHVKRHNVNNPDQPISTKSATVALWIRDQYEHDIADWERRARKHLILGCDE